MKKQISYKFQDISNQDLATISGGGVTAARAALRYLPLVQPVYDFMTGAWTGFKNQVKKDMNNGRRKR